MLKLILAFVWILIFPAILLLIARDWLWVEGLIFSGWFVVLCAFVLIYLYIKNPALLAERYKMPGSQGQKKWDVFVVILLVVLFTGWIAIMPLDAKRYNWTQFFPLWTQIIGFLLLLPSAILFIKCYIDNPYLSGLVRIQEERKHSVISTGVYSLVRHPMYLGATLLFIGTPMLLNSLYGLGLGILLTLLIAIRSVGEEKMLSEELDGYEEYKKQVKYRLVRYVW